MPYKNIMAVIATIVLFGCSPEERKLSIAEAEAAGFERGQQQLYQMVGAEDGWGGVWSGEKVELYQYENKGAIQSDSFKASTQPGNISGWVEVCQVQNLFMLSKGRNACRELESLAN